MTSNKNNLRQRQQRLQAELQQVQEQIAAAKKRKMIQCAACWKRTRIDTIDYIQTLCYERPYGCTGGDRWHDGEGCFVCPKCGVRNRLLTGNPRLGGGSEGFPTEHPYAGLRHSFREIIKIENHRLDRNFVNSYADKQGKIVAGALFGSPNLEKIRARAQAGAKDIKHRQRGQ